MKEEVVMSMKVLAVAGLVIALLAFAAVPATHAQDTRNIQRTQKLMDEVRHELVMLPYYSVFDWLEAEVRPDGQVVLKGMVTEPTLKSAAEANVKKLEAAVGVTNNIEVLPLSPADDQIRSAVYRNIFKYNSSLFKYAIQSVPPIHILVKNGHVQLKGMVLSQMDSQLAFMAAREVPGVFDVQNNLTVERDRHEDIGITRSR
jgi:hyperosmotically inducible periplasmic protein